jgi:adenylate cyclase
MAERLRPAPAVIAGICAGLALVLLSLTTPSGWRERSFDLMLAAVSHVRPAAAEVRFVFVDIDTASLGSVGPWPWPRETLARLVAGVAKAGPRAIALDMLLAEPDSRSPAALARQLAAQTGRADLAALAEILVDGDRALIAALEAAPAALGWVLDPRGDSAIAPAQILIREGARLGRLWNQDRATGPPIALADAASGAGAISLPGDADGLVRRVPLLVSVGGRIAPGLALEALRLAAGASGYLIAGEPPRLRLGEIERPLPGEGMLRLAPTRAEPPATIAAAALLAGRHDEAALKDAIVFIGGSGPELGALRPSPSGPLTASTLIQIDAARQFLAGIVPRRPAWALAAELGVALVLILAATCLTLRLRPLQGALALAALLATPVLGALIAASRDRLLDPSAPLAAGAAAWLASALWSFSETRLREARLRRRFEQHLAPGVVERIVANPESLKLSGERRAVTALFTDIEGFTAMTRRIEPERLVGVLDGYFEGVVGIVNAHGGMVDKFVGDAVHALFNVPLDLPEHPRRAVACAVALQTWTEAHRHRGMAGEIGFGRTRIGIETGEAIVGDVGVGSKLDYTAYGEAVNMAARLEALNKQLGTSICIGPGAAAFCGPSEVRKLALVEIAGVGPVEVFAPQIADPAR